MTGGSSLCIEGRILPLDGAHVSHEQFNFRWPLPHVAGSPDLEVLSASLTSVRSSGRPRFVGLSDPTSYRLSLTALPCSHGILRLHAGGTNPGSNSEHLPLSHTEFLPSPLRDKVGYFHHDRFRGYVAVSLSFRPATSLSTLRNSRHRHHARLGTRLLARLCRGPHFRRLNPMSFQGTTLSHPFVERLIGSLRREYLDHTTCCSERRQIWKTSCSISRPTSTTIARIPHGKGERPIRPRHDQSPISARFDGNPTVGPSIRRRWLPDLSKTRVRCDLRSTLTKLPFQFQEIIRSFFIAECFAGPIVSLPTVRPESATQPTVAARLSVKPAPPVTIRQRQASILHAHPAG